jgi:hypothetical protein
VPFDTHSSFLCFRLKAVISELKAEGLEGGSSLISSLEYAGEVLALLAARTE